MKLNEIAQPKLDHRKWEIVSAAWTGMGDEAKERFKAGKVLTLPQLDKSKEINLVPTPRVRQLMQGMEVGERIDCGRGVFSLKLKRVPDDTEVTFKRVPDEPEGRKVFQARIYDPKYNEERDVKIKAASKRAAEEYCEGKGYDIIKSFEEVSS